MNNLGWYWKVLIMKLSHMLLYLLKNEMSFGIYKNKQAPSEIAKKEKKNDMNFFICRRNYLKFFLNKFESIRVKIFGRGMSTQTQNNVFNFYLLANFARSSICLVTNWLTNYICSWIYFSWIYVVGSDIVGKERETYMCNILK